jgi:hypothetical protein
MRAKIILDNGEIVRARAALHLDQGLAVTRHASQAKTVDQVMATAPVRSFSQANEAQFISCHDVACEVGQACLYR